LSQGDKGGVSGSNKNLTNPVGVAQTLPQPTTNLDGSKYQPPPEAIKVFSYQSQSIGSYMGNQTDTPYATYVIKNDNSAAQGTVNPTTKRGYFDHQQNVDSAYLDNIRGNPKTKAPSTIPYTDQKGYEVMAPFPWGRWQDLNSAIRQFTELGFITPPTDVNGDFTEDLEDQTTLQNASAFLFAGLGTPTTTNDPSTSLVQALNQNIALVGGSLIAQTAQTGATNPATGQSTNSTSPKVDYGQQKSIAQPDATVIVLHYDPSQTATTGVNSLLNASQPENKFAEKLLLTTQSSAQQTVDVLVSGSIAPIPAVQEALLATQTQPQPNQNVSKLNKGINQQANLKLIAKQQQQQSKQFGG
jgi:hypothetical protein